MVAFLIFILFHHDVISLLVLLMVGSVSFYNLAIIP